MTIVDPVRAVGGFDGVVVSDWGSGVRSARMAATRILTLLARALPAVREGGTSADVADLLARAARE